MKRKTEAGIKITIEKLNKPLNGFTLIELMVVLVISAIVISMTFSLLSFNQVFFDEINSRVDVQAEFRIMLKYLEKELSTAREINLANEVDATVPAGFSMFYNEDVSGNGKLVKKVNVLTSDAVTSTLIAGLRIEFIRTDSKIIKVKMVADGGHYLEKDIFAQNAEVFTGDYDVEYPYVRVYPY